MDFQNAEVKLLINSVVTRIRCDQSDIVAKTGKKLIIELDKCYPNQFKTNYIESMNQDIYQQVCKAILEKNDDLLTQLLSKKEA